MFRQIYISGESQVRIALNEEYIGLEEIGDGLWNIVYYDTLLGRIDQETKTITGAPSLKKMCNPCARTKCHLCSRLLSSFRVSRPTYRAMPVSEMADTDAAKLLAKAMALPANTRLTLADELLDSVERPPDPAWAKAWAAELDRRVRQLEAGEVETIPADEALASARARLRKR